MNVQDRLRQAIDAEQERLRKTVPGDREGAVRAVSRQLDTLPNCVEPVPDLVLERQIADLGGSKALQLCLESSSEEGGRVPAGTGWNGWAKDFLQACGRLAEAELVLGHVETGFMRVVEDGDDAFDAWIATRRAPTSWRERADIDWWANWLTGRYEPEARALEAVRPDSSIDAAGHSAHYRRLADVYLKMMAYQLSYPPEAVIGGCTIQTYRDVLRELLAEALQVRDRGEEVAPRSASALIAEIERAIAIDPAMAERAVAGFTLNEENATYHAAVPGVAAAPVVQVAPDQIVLSWHGLSTEPIRRRDRPRVRRAGERRRPATGHYEEFEPETAVRGRSRAAVDPGGRRRARRRRPGLAFDDARAVRRRRPPRAGRRLSRRGAAAVGAQDDAAQGGAAQSAAPGTRTAPSWATCGRSTCGCRCRAAATRRRAWTSCLAGSTTSSIEHVAMLDVERTRARGRGGGGRRGDRAADLRARRRAVLRRDVPAPDRLGPGDAEPALRDRELVLRRAPRSPPTTRRSPSEPAATSATAAIGGPRRSAVAASPGKRRPVTRGTAGTAAIGSASVRGALGRARGTARPPARVRGRLADDVRPAAGEPHDPERVVADVGAPG